MSILPKDDKARKGLPLLKQIGYFPKALREITKVSVVNNVRYNPDRDPFDINWAKGKSSDQMGSGFRHVFEHEFGGQVFDEVPTEIAKVTGIERVYVLAEAAWRALAALETEIEKVEAAETIAMTEVKETAEERTARIYGWVLNKSVLLLCTNPKCEGHESGGGWCCTKKDGSGYSGRRPSKVGS